MNVGAKVEVCDPARGRWLPGWRLVEIARHVATVERVDVPTRCVNRTMTIPAVLVRPERSER